MQPVLGSPIRHVIVVVQENRTFDNLFAASVLAGGGPYPGADTSQTTTVDGAAVHLKPVPFEDPGDPSHTHASLLSEWNGGKMDGFGDVAVRTAFGSKPESGFAYAFVPSYETTIYHLLAARYALADENFAPRLVPTFPSHYTLATGQSRIAGNPKSAIWGCDAASDVRVPVFGAGETTVTPGVFPCFDQTSIVDLLDAGHVTWKYYTGAVFRRGEPDGQYLRRVSKDSLRSRLASRRRDALGGGAERHRALPFAAGFVRDAELSRFRSCRKLQCRRSGMGRFDLSGGRSEPARLSAVRLLSEQRDRPHMGRLRRLVRSRSAAGRPGRDEWGFRIPIVVISPWARSGYDAGRPHAAPYVSHTRRESTSITAFIEKNWGLGNMGQRDATDDDLSDMFDYTRADAGAVRSPKSPCEADPAHALQPRRRARDGRTSIRRSLECN